MFDKNDLSTIRAKQYIHRLACRKLLHTYPLKVLETYINIVSTRLNIVSNTIKFEHANKVQKNSCFAEVTLMFCSKTCG